MGLLDRLRNAFGQRSISTVQLIQENGTRYMAWHGGLYDADIVRACIRPKAKAVGKLVAKHIRETVDANGERSIAVNPAPGIRRLLEEPNPYMTGQVMQEKLATQLCLNNNAFALIVRDDMGLPTGIYPVCRKRRRHCIAMTVHWRCECSCQTTRFYIRIFRYYPLTPRF